MRSSSRTEGAGGVALAALMLATLLANVASVCLFPHIVTLSTEFDQPVSTVVWSIVAFHVVAVGVGGVAAALGAVFGNRLMLVVTLVLLLAGCLLAALSTNLAMLIAARMLQGVGMAIQALAVGVIANFWRGHGMRRAISMIVLAIGLGAVIAYLASGLIWRSGGDWRTIFWILSGATALDVLLTMAFIRETPRARGVSIDYVGSVGLVVWALLLLIPLSQANAWGWGSTKVLGLLLPGLAAIVLWVLWELRTSAPLIDLRIMRHTGVWQAAFGWFAISVSLIVPATALPYLLQTPEAAGFGFATDIFVVSLVLAVSAVAMVILSPVASPLMRRLGAKGTMLLGAVCGLSAFGLAFAHSSMWMILVWLVVLGALPAWEGSAGYAVGTEAVPPEKGVIVSTMCNTAGAIGAAVASAAVGYVLTLRQVTVEIATPGGTVIETHPAEAAFTWSALLVGVLALANIACVLTIRSKQLARDRRAEFAPVALGPEA